MLPFITVRIQTNKQANSECHFQHLLAQATATEYTSVHLQCFGEFIERVAHPTDFLLKRVVQSNRVLCLLTQHIRSQTNRKKPTTTTTKRESNVEISIFMISKGEVVFIDTW